MAKSLEVQVYPRVNIWLVLYIKQRPWQELVNHLQQNDQEVPSSIDIIITQEGYRIKTIF